MLDRPGRGPTRREVLGAAALAAGAALPRRARTQAVRAGGGTLRLGLGHGSTSDTIDPGAADNVFTQVLAQARNAYLVEVAPDDALVGELAESWEPSADAAQWTFRLRRGVTFHNGRTLTAADVVASLDHHRQAGSGSAARSLVEPIREVRADGDAVVAIRLVSGNLGFPALLSDGHLPILQSSEGRIDPADPVGAGPFVLASFQPGVRATATRNPDHFRATAGGFEGLELLSILDAGARVEALLSDAVDAIDRVDPAAVPGLERRAGVRVLSVAGGQHYGFPMDTRAAPFADPDVRLALKHAIDRQALVDEILRGHGSPGNDQPIHRSSPDHAALDQRAYDPHRARFHLRRAGLEGITLPIHLAEAAFPGCLDAGLLFAERAAAAGITLHAVDEPDDGYWAEVWRRRPFAATCWAARPTADAMLTIAYARGAAWNETHWDHGRFNELLVRARGERDEGLRREMLAQMQALVRDEGGIVIPAFANHVMACSDRLGLPPKLGAHAALDDLRAPERWWFEG